MKFLLGEIAALLGTSISPDCVGLEITGVASVGDALPGEITFFSHPKYLATARTTGASAILVPADFSEDLPPVVLRVENPSAAFTAIVAKFAPPPRAIEAGIHPSASVSEHATLAEGVSVQAGAVIEAGARIGRGTVIGVNTVIGHDAVVGEDCILHPLVSIQERCTVGDRVIIHCGAVIGSDGFGFDTTGGRNRKVPQTGIVCIEDDVEIGANTTIDRARFGRTWIQQGVVIDNLVQIAHNVVIGRHSIVVAQVGISGSTRIGSRVTLAGQVGIVGHVEIGDGTVVAAKSGISKNVPAGSVLWGSPAVPMREAKESLAAVRRLPGLIDKVRALEKRIAELESAAGA